MSTLYVVATPIGNLEDISYRAVRVLSEVTLIAAEDTRHTRKLLAHADVHTRLISFHEHSSPARLADLVERLDEGDMALVTDAGTPGVSDPGAALVASALEAGHAVVPVPGPSAVSAALSVSGMAADSYVFLGFLPRRSKDRRALLDGFASEMRCLVVFEAPHRLLACLSDLADAFGSDRTVAVSRELTKRFEEVWRGTIGAAAEHWSTVSPRGEFTLVISGADETAAEPWDDDRIYDALRALRDEGLGARESAKRIAAESGMPAREIYRMWHHGDRMEEPET